MLKAERHHYIEVTILLAIRESLYAVRRTVLPLRTYELGDDALSRLRTYVAIDNHPSGDSFSHILLFVKDVGTKGTTTPTSLTLTDNITAVHLPPDLS